MLAFRKESMRLDPMCVNRIQDNKTHSNFNELCGNISEIDALKIYRDINNIDVLNSLNNYSLYI